MTSPRCLEPGQTYLVTRRCAQRSFLLRPDDAVRGILLYCLANAAERFGITIHAFAFLSNHYHLVLTDSKRRVALPKFMAWLNLYSARMINILRGRSENLWAPGSYNAVVLADEAAVIDKIVYTICNPVAAGLVASPELWPGLISLPQNLEQRRFEAERPGFFTKRQAKRASLKLLRPPCLQGLSSEAYRRLIKRRVRDRLAAIAEKRVAEGRRGFLGRRAILEQDPEGRPAEPKKEDKSKPCLACKDRKLRERLLKNQKQFRADHRAAFQSWQGGKRDVPFPKGTYLMVELHRAASADSPSYFSLE